MTLTTKARDEDSRVVGIRELILISTSGTIQNWGRFIEEPDNGGKTKLQCLLTKIQRTLPIVGNSRAALRMQLIERLPRDPGM